MLRIVEETSSDVAAREHLLDEAFGIDRHLKTCERLREGRLPARGLALVAKDGDRVVGTLRFWHVASGDGRECLMLGPLAVANSHRSHGLGSLMMRRGLTLAGAYGHRAVLLVGDEPYYARFGFTRAAARHLDLPGWYQPERFLGLELREGALAGAHGMVVATGERNGVVPMQAGADADGAEAEGERA